MSERPTVRMLSFATAPAFERERGLLGWLTLDVDGLLLLGGVALRRTQDGRLTFSWPARADSRGRRHAIIRPMDEASRLAIEANLLKQLGLEPGKAESR